MTEAVSKTMRSGSCNTERISRTLCFYLREPDETRDEDDEDPNHSPGKHENHEAENGDADADGRGLRLEDMEMPAHTILRTKTTSKANLTRPLPTRTTCGTIAAVPPRGGMEAILTRVMRVQMKISGQGIETKEEISEEVTAAPAFCLSSCS